MVKKSEKSEFGFMKSKLQYGYSISVLIGVFVTAYLMISGPQKEGVTARSQTPTFRMEAQSLDPAVSQLLDMENALNELRKKGQEKRIPADIPEIGIKR